MSTAALLLSLLFSPGDLDVAADREQEDLFFCCEWVDASGNDGAGVGGECTPTTGDKIGGCTHWLACPGGATGSDGVVTCTNPKGDKK